MSGRAEQRLARGPALTAVVLAFALTALLAALLVPWSWVPGGHLVPARASSLFTAGQLARAERYSWWQRGLGWTSYALSLAVLGWFALTVGGARTLRRVVDDRRWWVAVPLATLTVLVAQRLVTLPLAAWSHQVDRDYGTSTQPFAGWGVDQLKGLGVGWVTTTLALLVGVGLARRVPRWWFAWAGGAALVLTVAGSFLYPVLVEPVFNTFTPVRDAGFRHAVLRLAQREHVHVDDVLEADASRRTTTLNAYVSGIGSTRRVVVYDTLLNGLPRKQVLVVVAHELGHAEHHDVVIGTTLGAIAGVGGVSLLALALDSERLRRRTRVDGPSDPAAVGVILALVAVGTLLASPVQNTVSRAIEARADRTSLEATHADRAFVEMQRQLALRSLQDPTPPWLSQLWWGSHPTVLQRAGLPASLREVHR